MVDAENRKKIKLAYIGAAPAYYFSPFLRKLSAEEDIDLEVYWGSDETLKVYHEKEFDEKIESVSGLIDGYSSYFVKNIFGKGSYQKGFFGLFSLELLVKLYAGRFDFVIVHGWQYLNNILVILLAPIIGYKVILRAETPLNQEINRSGCWQYLRKILLKLIFKNISKFLFIGKENKDFYKYYGVDDSRLHFAPYSVDNEFFRVSNANKSIIRAKIRNSLSIKNNEIVLLFVGKLIHKKRPGILIEAMNTLPENIKLIYVGSGELREQLQTRTHALSLDKRIIFAGYKTQEEIKNIMFASDLFVLPSGDGETWGLVVNEALASGLPVITSDRVGSARDLATDDNGAIFELDNAANLGQVISEFVSLKKLDIFGENSLKLSRIYSPETVVLGIREAITN